VDFITQRNYGIYFDINREAELLQAGLEEYQDVRQQLTKARLEAAKQNAREKKAAAATAAEKAAAEKAAEELERSQTVDENLASNWESLTQYSDPKKYRALLRELTGE